MRVTLLCVGRLGDAPEARLALDYAARATVVGRALGFGPIEIVEAEARKPGKAAEGVVLLDRVSNDHLIACDEHGPARTSRDFAAHLARLRDDGVRRTVFAIGGADGLDQKVLSAARERMALGPPDLAARAGPHHARRADLPRRDDHGRVAVP